MSRYPVSTWIFPNSPGRWHISCSCYSSSFLDSLQEQLSGGHPSIKKHMSSWPKLGDFTSSEDELVPFYSYGFLLSNSLIWLIFLLQCSLHFKNNNLSFYLTFLYMINGGKRKLGSFGTSECSSPFASSWSSAPNQNKMLWVTKFSCSPLSFENPWLIPLFWLMLN